MVLKLKLVEILKINTNFSLFFFLRSNIFSYPDQPDQKRLHRLWSDGQFGPGLSDFWFFFLH